MATVLPKDTRFVLQRFGSRTMACLLKHDLAVCVRVTWEREMLTEHSHSGASFHFC